MKQDNKCLIVGLQDTGKSTYIAAFWAIEKDGDTGHQLSFDTYPDNTEYLDSIGNLWLEQEPVNRSPINAQELEFKLKDAESGEKINLAIPDFKGERFKRLLQNEEPSEIVTWLADASSILFFLPPTPERIFNEEMMEGLPEKTDYAPGDSFNVDEIEPWIQCIELLKYIHSVKGDIKIAFCVSKWDSNMGKKIKVDKWIATEHLFFCTFVRKHFHHVKYYGVSAQGLDYENRGELNVDKVSMLTDKRERAYISDGISIDHDITKPLSWLLND